MTLQKRAKSITHSAGYPWIVILLCAAFLFYKYVMQVSPSVMTHQLMQSFQVHGTGLGNIAATFFYAYLITQLFVGVLLDRYSPRYLCSAAILVSVAGTYLFAKSHTLFFAEVARAMMGAGAAFATVCYIKMAATWFDPKKFAFVSGLLTTAVMLGAIFAEAPLAWLVHAINWQNSLIIVSAFGTLVCILFFLIVRDAPNTQAISQKGNHTVCWRDVRAVLQKKENWLLAFYSGLAFSPVVLFSGLWGNTFFHELYHIPITQSASLISLSFFGLALGGPVLGYLSDALGNRRGIILWGLIITFASLMPVLYFKLPFWLLGSLLFLFGFSTGAFMLAFAIGKEINPIALAATVMAMINTGEAIISACSEPLVGRLLDLNWNHEILNGAPHFSVSNFHFAFLILPVYLAAAFALAWLIHPHTD